MGAVVGALYASGYSGTELETFANEEDWFAVFDDSTVCERTTFRRKTDQVGFTDNLPASTARDLGSGRISQFSDSLPGLAILQPVVIEFAIFDGVIHEQLRVDFITHFPKIFIGSTHSKII